MAAPAQVHGNQGVQDSLKESAGASSLVTGGRDGAK